MTPTWFIGRFNTSRGIITGPMHWKSSYICGLPTPGWKDKPIVLANILLYARQFFHPVKRIERPRMQDYCRLW